MSSLVFSPHRLPSPFFSSRTNTLHCAGRSSPLQGLGGGKPLPHRRSNTPTEGRRILHVWKALGGSFCYVLSDWKALGGSFCRVLRVWRGSKSCTLRQKVRQKHVPLGRKSASKRQKRVPLGNKCVKNMYPYINDRGGTGGGFSVTRCLWPLSREASS